VRLAALVVRSMRVLGRPEGDEDDQLLIDVVEAMGDIRADEDHRSRSHGPNIVAHRHPGSAGNDVIDLVLGVRALGIGAAGGQDVQPDREVVRPYELEERTARCASLSEQLHELEGLHGPGA
jgi:hypothetical protein